ncbi:respiratory nitrate reductase subunit gamma [bacterium]|nr:respiratory nitrate reductase subunit gamma [bacterium]
MTPVDIFLWAVCPYISFTILIVGTVIRRVFFARTWTSKSSEFLEKRQERVATPLFHAALLFVFFGHLGGFLIPKTLTDAVGFTEEMYHVVAFSMGGLAGTALVLGLALLIRRRFGHASPRRIRANTSAMDKVLYVVLTATILSGFIATFSNASGAYVYREGIMPWIRGVVALHPDPTLVMGAPIPFKVHMCCWMVFFALLPFTRIVHMFSGVTAPFKYLRRPAVVYRRDEGVVAAAAVPGVGVQAGVAERPREFPRGASYGEHEGARS